LRLSLVYTLNFFFIDFNLGNFFTETLKNLDFSEQTLFRVNLLLSQYDDIKDDLEPTQDTDEDNAAE